MPVKKAGGLKDLLVVRQTQNLWLWSQPERGWVLHDTTPPKEKGPRNGDDEEEGCAIDSVERVFEVNFEQCLIVVPCVALEPLACHPNAYLSSQGLGHPYL